MEGFINLIFDLIRLINIQLLAKETYQFLSWNNLSTIIVINEASA